jgi:AAT family amino acid transporter/D-serine/D-alanine/glycine transporter
MVFDRIGIPAAGGIINFVVITAAASSCNSGIFSTGRMLYTLAQFGQAPRFLGKVNAGHVPAVAVTVSAAVMLIGVLLNYVVPEQVFVWVISVATVGALWTWAMILIAHMGYRRAVAEGRAQPSPFRMPGSPVTNWIALAFIVLVTCFLALDPNTRVALYVGPVWFGILAVGYRLTKSRELAVA